MENKLKTLRLENCQSWKDATIEFGDGLNAIIASNNVGKSVIFKIIKITCNPEFFSKPERKKLIRYGHDFARATFTFEDGSIATTLITDKKIIYKFTDKDGKIFHSEEEPLNQTLQYLSVIVEDNSKYMVNVLDSEQSLLLVKSDKKANSDLMRVITEHKGVTRLTQLFKEKIKYYSGYEIELKKKENRLKRRLKEINIKDIDIIEQEYLQLRMMSKLLSSLEIIQNKNKCIEDNLVDLTGVNWDLIKSFFLHINYIDFLPEERWVSILKLLEVLPKSNLEYSTGVNWVQMTNLLQVLPKNKIDVVDNIINWGLLTDLLNQRKEIILPKLDINFKLIKNILNLNEITYKMNVNLNEIENIQKQINELNSIDFNGTVYECPVHGKIIYKNGKCEVASNE